MIIKTPQKYISGADIIRTSGKLIAEYAKNPLIIGSRSALSAVLNELRAGLKENSVIAENVEIFKGF